MTDPLAATIRADIERLCAAGDRDLGTQRNRDATAYVADRLRESGAAVEVLPFEVPEWRYGSASVAAGDLTLDINPGPFSPALDASGPLVIIETAEQLAGVRDPGAVLLLHGAIAATQFTPRDYPFYSDEAHARVLDALESARPLAVLAATTSSSMTGAMSPFPLIEEVRFAAPSAYMTAEQGAQLAKLEGQTVRVRIDSEVVASSGEQPVGRLGSAGAGRVIVSAHVDSKPGTPGAIDNAAGVAVMLAVADLLGELEPENPCEFVAFNGEDHVLAPGELAWLAANPNLSEIALVINLDAPGLPGAPSAYSLYGVDDARAAALARLAARHPAVAEGPQWYASDHMVFAMRGVPAVAITSTDFHTASRVYSHTPTDSPEILDYDLLAGTARFVADAIRG